MKSSATTASSTASPKTDVRNPTDNLRLKIGENASLDRWTITPTLAATFALAMARASTTNLHETVTEMVGSMQGSIRAARAIVVGAESDQRIDGNLYEGLRHVIELANELADGLDELLGLDCILVSRPTDEEDADD